MQWWEQSSSSIFLTACHSFLGNLSSPMSLEVFLTCLCTQVVLTAAWRLTSFSSYHLSSSRWYLLSCKPLVPDWKVSIPGVAGAGPWLDRAHELQSAGGLVTSTYNFDSSYSPSKRLGVFVCFCVCCVVYCLYSPMNFFYPLILEFKKIYQYVSMCESLLINFASNMWSTMIFILIL